MPEKSVTFTDDELMPEIVRGNREAFSQLYERHWEDLLITAARALRSTDGAADVVQDVFVSLWQRRETLAIEGSVSAYLHTSVRYHCIHYIEKNIIRRDYLARLAEVMVSSSEPKADSILRLKEIQRSLDQTVASMPPRMQRAYLLSREKHHSYRQISDVMGISVETVKKHIHHALQLIKKDLFPLGIIIILVKLFC